MFFFFSHFYQQEKSSKIQADRIYDTVLMVFFFKFLNPITVRLEKRIAQSLSLFNFREKSRCFLNCLGCSILFRLSMIFCCCFFLKENEKKPFSKTMLLSKIIFVYCKFLQYLRVRIRFNSISIKKIIYHRTLNRLVRSCKRNTRWF